MWPFISRHLNGECETVYLGELLFSDPLTLLVHRHSVLPVGAAF